MVFMNFCTKIFIVTLLAFSVYPLSVSSGEQLHGTVTSVTGEKILIELSSQRSITPGDKAELYYLTSGGMRLKVGQCRVTEVDEMAVSAIADQQDTTLRTGLHVVFLESDQKSATNNPDASQIINLPKQKPVPTNVSGAGDLPVLEFLGEPISPPKDDSSADNSSSP